MKQSRDSLAGTSDDRSCQERDFEWLMIRFVRKTVILEEEKAEKCDRLPNLDMKSRK
jgi:hypothetical protein